MRPVIPSGQARGLAAVSDLSAKFLLGLLGFPVRAVVIAGQQVPANITLDDLLFHKRAWQVESVVIPIRGAGLEAALTDRNLDAMVNGGVILVLAFERKSEAIRLGYMADTGGVA